MSDEFTQAELEAYLEEALDTERATRIEKAVRERPELLKRLSEVNARRDSGVHTLGEIWRRHQLAVPSREELGSFLLGILSDEQAEYIKFRINVLKCPFTIANLRDLEDESEAVSEAKKNRRTKYLNSTSEYFPQSDAQDG